MAKGDRIDTGEAQGQANKKSKKKVATELGDLEGVVAESSSQPAPSSKNRRTEDVGPSAPSEPSPPTPTKMGSEMFSGNQFSALAALRMKDQRKLLSKIPNDRGEANLAALEHISGPQMDANLSDDDMDSDVESTRGEEGSELERPPKRMRSNNVAPQPASIHVSTFRPSVSNTVLVEDNGRTFAICGMLKGQELSFEGAAAIGCLRGSCTVGGFELSATARSNEWFEGQGKHSAESLLGEVVVYPAFSSRVQSLLVIAAGSKSGVLGNRTPDGSMAFPQRERDRLAPALQKNRKQLSLFENVVIMADMKSSGVLDIALESVDNKDLFGGADEEGNAELAMVEGARYVDVIMQPGPRAALKVPDEWDSAFKAITDCSDNGGSPLVVAVVGAKNTGKSTFSRLLTNRLLSTLPRVAYLDSDIGQCEFTPHGAASVQLLEGPLLGPPFTHCSQPFRSLFLGSSSPERDPDAYLESLRQLVDTYRDGSLVRDTSAAGGLAPPLVVNTHGWVKGMGFDMLAYFLDYLRPTHIIELRSFEFARNASGDFHAVGSAISDSGSCNITTVIQVPAHESLVQLGTKLGAADARNLMLTSYFYRTRLDQLPTKLPLNMQMARMWDFKAPIAASNAAVVPMDALVVQFIGSEVHDTQVLRALNGTLVALCEHTSQTKADTPGGDDFSPDTKRTARSNTLGLGIVRGIGSDFSHKQAFFLHILTPVSLERLAKCRLLVRGSEMDLPVNLLARGVGDQGTTDVPYLTTVTAGVAGAKEWKARSNLTRRSQAGTA